ncbi:mediator complex, subunit Med10 [Hypoxylon crocopeplum]|nr:mediator complex, subunit Med10 [Hypoxylon crocopeplum]
MAPMSRVDHDALEQQLKDTIQTLTNVMVQVTNFDATSSSTPGGSSSSSSTRPSREVIANELRTLSATLQAIHARSTADSAALGEPPLPSIPPELVQYVDNGRNPDIYTREFVELVRRGNQLMRGKQQAFASFRDVLAGEMDKAMPELRPDTRAVLEATGGPRR